MGCTSSKGQTASSAAWKDAKEVPLTDAVPPTEQADPSASDSTKVHDEEPAAGTAPVPDVRPGMEVNDVKRSASGRVLKHTATDVLVKFDDGRTEWVEIEDLEEKKQAAPPNEEVSPKPADSSKTAIPEQKAPETAASAEGATAEPEVPHAFNLEGEENSKAACC
eukprot:TRINITY_DN79405_c0_g1_i1.p1 TRINITY_DN79405_c0_g1~~TRINITY_DN79405_c0_g1_i1.p1  ORF type:complete len:165 (-),score=44.26 TRINITY_DN79405_c0_g1_i1:199-693(-)